MPKPLLCNPKPFKDQFRRDTKERKERRYCFILGAGASVSSGLPSGKHLAAQWLEELYHRQCPAPALGKTALTLADWCAHEDCPVQGVDPKNPGAHYPQLFLARFPGSDPEGQRFVQEAIRGADLEKPNLPSVGYAYLARLLQNTDSRVVITTNFDNLAADSLLLFTGSLPRVIGHERVASFAGLRDGQPLIAKIHGDVGFVTANDPDGVSKLPEEWHAPLRDIFRDHIPVFIGYDGNDGSLMDFVSTQLFESGPGFANQRSLLRSGIYWCYRAGDGRDWKARLNENSRLKKLTESHQVHFVPIGDFDLWMMELGEACGVGDPEKILRESMERRVKILSEQLSKSRSEQAAPSQDAAVEASRAETREEIGKRLSEWDFVYKGAGEKDLPKAEAFYQKAVQLAPNNAAILCNYALFLANRQKDPKRADTYFRSALNADPEQHVTVLRAYALFLSKDPENKDAAEGYFQRAIAADPNDPDTLGDFAVYCIAQKNNKQLAAEYFEKALAADNNHAGNLGNYARFLTDELGDFDRAEACYLKALSAEPNHSQNLTSFAVFLSDKRRDYDRAERFFKHAISVNPNYAGAHRQFARFLSKRRNDNQKAEEHYRRSLTLAPKDLANLQSYAIFLSDHQKNYRSAEKYYLEAIAAAPNDPINLRNFALFLSEGGNDYDRAEEYFLKAYALSKDPSDLCAHAQFIAEQRGNEVRAEEMYEKAIEVDPNNPDTYDHFATFLFLNRKNNEKCEKYLLKALEIQPQHPRANANYAFLLWQVQKDYDSAEFFYRKYLALGGNDPFYLRKIAEFLRTIRHNETEAVALEARAKVLD